MLRATGLGAAVYVWAFLDDERLGVTRGKAMFTVDVRPGEYVVWHKAENVAAATLEVAAVAPTGRASFERPVGEGRVFIRQ